MVGPEDTIVSYIEATHRSYELNRDLVRSNLTRLAWLAAICGYAIINVRSLWGEMLGDEFLGQYSLATASAFLPWILTALLAILTHNQSDIWLGYENDRYKHEIAELDLLRMRAEDGKIEPSRFRKIMDGKTESLEERGAAALSAYKRLKWLDNSTFWFLFVSFLWTAIGPFILPLMLKQ